MPTKRVLKTAKAHGTKDHFTFPGDNPIAEAFRGTPQEELLKGSAVHVESPEPPEAPQVQDDPAVVAAQEALKLARIAAAAAKTQAPAQVPAYVQIANLHDYFRSRFPAEDNLTRSNLVIASVLGVAAEQLSDLLQALRAVAVQPGSRPQS